MRERVGLTVGKETETDRNLDAEVDISGDIVLVEQIDVPLERGMRWGKREFVGSLRELGSEHSTGDVRTYPA